MGHDAQMLLVRFVDDRRRHGVRHLDGNGLALVIHPQLDEINPLGGLFIDQLAAFFGRGDGVGHPH